MKIHEVSFLIGNLRVSFTPEKDETWKVWVSKPGTSDGSFYHHKSIPASIPTSKDAYDYANLFISSLNRYR